MLPPQTLSGEDVSAPIWGADTSPPDTTTTNRSAEVVCVIDRKSYHCGGSFYDRPHKCGGLEKKVVPKN